MMQVLNDNVVLRKLKDSEKTTTRESGLIIPGSAEDNRYVVVFTGPGRKTLFTGDLVANTVCTGDIVILSGEPVPMRVPGEDLYFVVESDVIAIVGSVEE